LEFLSKIGKILVEVIGEGRETIEATRAIITMSFSTERFMA